jgi:hypothetical protein
VQAAGVEGWALAGGVLLREWPGEHRRLATDRGPRAVTACCDHGVDREGHVTKRDDARGAEGPQQLPADQPVLEMGEVTLEGLASLMEGLGPVLADHTETGGRTDWAAVEAEMRTRGEALRAALLGGMEDFDVFDVLSNLLLFNLPSNWDTYRESEHAGRLVNVEYAAALLLSRPHRRGAADLREPAEVGSQVRRWNETITELLVLRGFQHMASLHTADPTLAQAQYQQFQLELSVRNPCYDFQEERHLSELFGDGTVEADLREAVGFTINECLRMMSLCEQRIGHALVVGGNDGLDSVQSIREQLEALRQGRLSGDTPDLVERLAYLDEDDLDTATHAYATWSAWNKVGDRAAFTARDLATSAEVGVDAAQSFLQLFSQPLDMPAHDDPVRALQQVKRRPVLRDADEHLSLGGGDLLFAAREALESALKGHSHSAWQRYERHRSSWTASQVARLLGMALSPDILEQEVTWAEGDDRYEMDVLIVIDRIVITVEVKAGAFTEPARRGVAGRLQRDLQNLVGKADQQARRAVGAIAGGVELRDRNGDVISVNTDHISSVIPMAVTLDELVVAPQLWALTRAGFLEGGPPPTMMSLTDLEIVVDVLNRPGRLLHYLTRRARMNAKGGLVAHEEADLIMYYLRQGLYLEDVPDNVTRVLESETDDLDAYYYFEYGIRQSPADKPAPRLHTELQEIIHVLEEHRPDGWTLTAALLLDMSEDTQNWLGDHIATLKESSRTEGAKRDLSMAIDGSTRGLSVATAGDGDVDRLVARAEFLATKNKYMVRAATWTVLAIDLSGGDRVAYLHLLLDDPWQQDDAMDELARETRLRLGDEAIGGL